MKILALVVTYRPDENLLVRNISAFAPYVDSIIIWRNSNEDLCFLEEWKDKIRFWGNGENKYLAEPINVVMRFAYNEGYDFILTMDQDSEWVNFKDFKDAVYQQWQSGGNHVGIYAPNVNGYLKDITKEYQDIEWVIQSGMLINLKKVMGLGGFREDYEIYGIDEEYCYWLRQHGLKIRSFVNSRLKQKYGKATKSKLGFTVLNYSPITRYHLIRNMIWMKREFPKSTVFRRIPHVFLLNLRDILFAESNKVKKTTALIKGIYDGLFGSIKYRCYS